MDLKDVLKKPILTEKSLGETAQGKYTFLVDSRATKKDICQAVKVFLKVTPVSVRTINVKGRLKTMRGTRKKKRTPDWKKARITLKVGEKIADFEVN
ncbi:50S ribosomal protein L23 [Patescibacteria group bacterium]